MGNHFLFAKRGGNYKHHSEDAEKGVAAGSRMDAQDNSPAGYRCTACGKTFSGLTEANEHLANEPATGKHLNTDADTIRKIKR